MRIDAASQAAARALSSAKAEGPGRLACKARVLKRALDFPKEGATELNKLLESKGRVIDIQA